MRDVQQEARVDAAGERDQGGVERRRGARAAASTFASSVHRQMPSACEEVGREVALAGVAEDGQHDGRRGRAAARPRSPRRSSRPTRCRPGGLRGARARARARRRSSSVTAHHLVVDAGVRGRRARSRRRCPGCRGSPARRPTARATPPARRRRCGVSARRLRSTSPTPVMVPPVPDAGDERVDARQLLQDLRPGRAAVHLGVGRIVELLRHEPVRVLGQQLLGAADGAVHALRVRGEHEPRAVGDQQRAPLLAHRVRHREHQAVALHRRDQRQADAGVAAGRLDDRAARPQPPVALRRLDHRAGRCGPSRCRPGSGSRASPTPRPRRPRAAAAAAAGRPESSR